MRTIEAVQTDPFRYGWRYVDEPQLDGSTRKKQVPLTVEDVLHPQEGDFIVHNDAHLRDVIYLRQVLQRMTKSRPGLLVLSDCRVDFGKPGVKVLGPDEVVFENVNAPWKNFEGTFPAGEFNARPLFVIEVTSPSTRDLDLDNKVIEYFRAGVPLYAILDARIEDDRRTLHLLGYRATPEGYVRLPLNDNGRLWLEPVRLWLGQDDGVAAFYDENEVRLPDALTHIEQAEERIEECQQLTDEAVNARRKAEAETAAEMRRREKAEADKADETRRREKAEADKAEEARLRTAIEARLAAMEAELSRLRGQS